MKSTVLSAVLVCGITSAQILPAQDAGPTPVGADPIFLSLRLNNREAVLSVYPGMGCRVESTTNLIEWTGLATLRGGTQVDQIDSAAPLYPARFYRYRNAETNAVTGDHVGTAEGEITIHPINHATFVMTWGGKVFYFDPVGGAGRFQGLPKPDLILLTHAHTDHYDAATLNAVKGSNTLLLAPPIVYQGMPSGLRSVTGVLTNGSITNLAGVSIEAVPAYNLTSTHHPKGVGNGYVLTVAGKRIYVSGDTEDTPEMRALRGIDVAFVSMNLPYTMSVDKAASAVREFQPKVIYPYHYSNSNVNRFKQLVGTDLPVEVRLRQWY